MAPLDKCFLAKEYGVLYTWAWAPIPRGPSAVAPPAHPLGPALHIVVFPWLAFGHIIPFLELSEQLAKRGHFVTFVSAPRNLAKLRPVAADVRPRIRLVPLPLPLVDGLQDGAESTADVPPEKVELPKIAFDDLAAPFASFLAEACADGEAREGHSKQCRP
ncbi:putative UDP-rhamnose:rhamnosyltransferase 1 [Miscanthus floridulus]|uniref:putative UDP-rhamnose:rhamnosyltransferase 1 n=1 Tax=Miscanthus floridulus TaxID=154761 RepID=UPI00345A3D8B